jgi:hypothetical protein
MIYFHRGDSVVQVVDTSRNLIDKFKKVLTRKRKQKECATFGEIRFYSGDRLLFLSAYSLGRKKCQCLMIYATAWPLTPETAEYLNNLK